MKTTFDIHSPVASGNGAHIIHSCIQENIQGYHVHSLNPNLAAFPNLLRPLRTRANIIHTVPEYGTVFFHPKAKNIVTFHNYFWDDEYRNQSSPIKNIYYRFFQLPHVRRALQQADIVTTVSRFTEKLIKEEFKDTEIIVIPNGVDTNRFTPTKSKNKVTKIRVLFSGNCSKRKGGDQLLAIANALPRNAELIVTGGLRKSKLALNHSRIKLLPSIPHQDMPEVYRSCDILLLPSYREGLSLSVLEAMACGLPVITYNKSSMGELIIDNQGGYLADFDHKNSIIEKLLNLLNSGVNIKEMGAFNREKVLREFKGSDMIAAYKNLFKESLEQSN